MDKYCVSANELLLNSYELASIILKSKFRPDFIIGIWRGGAPIGIAIQEFLKFFKIKTDHIAIRTSSYVYNENNIPSQNKEIRVHGLEYIVENANSHNRVLLVDDIFDSGRSIEAVLKTLKTQMRNNLPETIKIATVYYKPQNNKTNIIPDYTLKTTDKWIIFPHELEGLTMEEIRKEKGDEVADLLESL